jgi:CRISPR-associated protein Csx3
MHAHLRYAQMLAHMGQAGAFFQALMLAQPIQLSQRVPQAAPRQSNCYYSSSDAAFADRYEAMTGYHRIAQGDVALEGGWRVYSSGPGIALHLLLCTWLGVSCTASKVVLDPVMPQPLDGLEARVHICGRPVVVSYRVGPAGHGVQTVTLNGQALGFEREPNRYRTGAAAVSKAAFEAVLAADGNRLELQLG